MTLKEIAEHPELASAEERESIEKTIEAFHRLGEQMKYTLNGVSEDSGRTQEEISRSYYIETMLMSATLEAFVTCGEKEYKDLCKFVFNYVDKAFIWDLPISSFHLCLAKLCSVGMLEIKEKDEYNPLFAITSEGLAALRQQTYANLAQSALFNLRTQQLNDESLKLSRRSVWQNRLMVIVAFASVVIAFISLIAALN